MLRFTTLLRLSQGPGGKAWSAQRPKSAHRLSKGALQQSRARHHVHNESFAIQQRLNQELGWQQRQHARARRSLEASAVDLMYDRGGGGSTRRQGGNRSHEYRPPQARAAELATARQLLQLSEATRREMKRGRQRRNAAFRAEKSWR